MLLEQLIERINKFNRDEKCEDFEITEFFDKIGDEVPDSKELNKQEKIDLITALFNYQKRQDQDSAIDWSFLHLIEGIDEADLNIYEPLLIATFAQFVNSTTILLLNRLMNAIEGEKRLKYIEILRTIVSDTNVSKWVREEAKDTLEFQMSD